jgi:HK97 gp10 family phage protein
MISVSAKVTGPDISAMIDQDYQRRFNKVDKAIQKAGIKCAALAKKACPVDTGRLRSSIQYQGYILQMDVTTNVDYSKYIEFGTRYMQPRPFLGPAFQQAGQELLDELSTI